MGTDFQTRNPSDLAEVELNLIPGFYSPPEMIGLVPAGPIPPFNVGLDPGVIAPPAGCEVLIFQGDGGVPEVWTEEGGPLRLGTIVETQRDSVAGWCQALANGLTGKVIGHSDAAHLIVRVQIDDCL